MARTTTTSIRGLGGRIAPRRSLQSASVRAPPKELEQHVVDDPSDAGDEVPERTQSIRSSLQAIFKQGLSSSASPSFHRAFPEAPNPCLNVQGVGTVGLPLHVRDAEAIKRASQAPFSKTSETELDHSVRGTWEIDGKDVQFDNGAWVTFMDQVVHAVCDTLGVGYDTSQPRCDLYKLSLNEEGSHFKVHVDADKADGIFATITVILPSKFEGGAVHVSHGESSTVIDGSTNSHTSTTVLAWYTGVQHDAKAITGGRLLALSFNLIHTTDSLRPTLPSSPSSTTADLHKVLALWRDGEGGLAKIIYLLSHKYSRSNLSRSALEGADEQLLSELEAIARPLGFGIGLANFICTVHGYADVTSESDDEVSMDEIEEPVVDIENLVDLDGDLIQHEFDYDVATEILPDSFIRDITSGKYDRQDEHGRYTAVDEVAELERFYHRTVLVLWAPWTHYEIVYGEDAFSRACNDLASSTTSSPTSEENHLVRFVLNRMKGQCTTDDFNQARSSISSVACHWKDLTLWTASMALGPRLSVSSTSAEENIHTGIETFGFGALEPCLDTTVKANTNNLAVLTFLDHLESWVADTMDSDNAKPIAEWISAQRIHRLSNLNLNRLEGTWINWNPFLELAFKHNDPDFFEMKVLPQVKSHCAPSALPNFAGSLYDQVSIPATARTRMAQEILDVAASKVDFLCADPYARGTDREMPVTSFIEVCLRCGCESLLSKVLNRVMQVGHEKCRAEVMISVLNLLGLATLSQSVDKAVPNLAAFAKSTISAYVQAVDGPSAYNASRHIVALCSALKSIGQEELIESQLLPGLGASHIPSHALKDMLSVCRTKREAAGLDNELMQTFVARLAMKYATGVEFPLPNPDSNWRNVKDEKGRVQAGFDALKRCFEAGVVDGCTEVLKRFLVKPDGLDSGFLDSNVIPLLEKMGPLLREHEVGVTAPPIADPLRSLLFSWVGEVMGPQPANLHFALAPLAVLETWKCTCQHCLLIRRWLTRSPEETRRFGNIGGTNRQHLDKFLRKYAAGVATWSVNGSRPHELVVTKVQLFMKPILWMNNQAQGRKLLDAISTDPQDLRTILGPEYAVVAAQLGVATVTAIPGLAMLGPQATNLGFGQVNAIAGSSGPHRYATPNTINYKKRPTDPGMAGGSSAHPLPKRPRMDGSVGE